MNIALVGYGKMGKEVEKLINDDNLFIVDKNSPQGLFTLNQIKENVDCIIDFSSPSSLKMICEYVKNKYTPLIIATTGYSKDELKKIHLLGEYAPVLQASNFSLGIYLINKMVKEVAPLLTDDFDIEVIEIHHSEKIDAPSGSAKSIVESINDEQQYEYVYGRYGNKKRKKNEIGIHSVRGGNVVGVHEILFLGDDEVISLKHYASSRKIFAKGALLCAKRIVEKDKGFYTLDEMMK